MVYKYVVNARLGFVWVVAVVKGNGVHYAVMTVLKDVREFFRDLPTD